MHTTPSCAAVVAASIVVALTVSAATARAQTPDVWDAPPECGSAETVRQIAVDIAGLEVPSFVGRVTKNDETFRLDLIVDDDDPRVLFDNDCHAFVDAAAVIVALAADAPEPTTSSVAVTNRVVVRPAAFISRAPVASASRLAINLSASATADPVSLGRISGGPDVGIDLMVDHVFGGVRAAWWPEVVTGDEGARAKIGGFSIGADVGLAVGDHDRAQVDARIGPRLVLLSGEAIDAPVPRRDDGRWWLVEGSLGGVVPLTPTLSAFGAVGGRVSLQRPRFVAEGTGTLHVIPAGSVYLQLGVRVRITIRSGS